MLYDFSHIKNATQNLYNTFISYCKEIPFVFTTDNSVFFTTSPIFCDVYKQASQDDLNCKTFDFNNDFEKVFVISENVKDEFTKNMKLLKKYKYASYVEVDDILPCVHINIPYYKEFFKSASLVVSDNINDMKKHLSDIVKSYVNLYKIKDKNLLEEMEPRIHVVLSLNNKQTMLADQNHLTKLQAVNFKSFMENALEEEVGLNK